MGTIGLRIVSKLDICFLLMLFLTSCITEGKIGYDIGVTVSNSTSQSQWGRSQSTAVLTFHSDTVFNGDGNTSKYLNIVGFAGIGLKENTYTKEGRLRYEDLIELTSQENYIFIDKTVTNNSEFYRCEINESLPTFLYNENKIYYRGAGIRARNRYYNNEDALYTKYYSNRFSKTVRYAGTYTNGLITAEVTPARVDEEVLKNSATAFVLSSSSDQYSGFAFVSDSVPIIEEIYLGSFDINQIITKEYEGAKEVDLTGWLECCFSEGLEGGLSNKNETFMAHRATHADENRNILILHESDTTSS